MGIVRGNSQKARARNSNGLFFFFFQSFPFLPSPSPARAPPHLQPLGGLQPTLATLILAFRPPALLALYLFSWPPNTALAISPISTPL